MLKSVKQHRLTCFKRWSWWRRWYGHEATGVRCIHWGGHRRGRGDVGTVEGWGRWRWGWTGLQPMIQFALCLHQWGGGGGPSPSSVLMMSTSGLVGQLGTTGGGTALPKLELQWWKTSSYDKWYKSDVRIIIRNYTMLYVLLRNRLVIEWGEGRSMRESGRHRTLDRLRRWTAAST